MIKIHVVGSYRYVVRYIGARENCQFDSPCFMGLNGYALCGIMHKGETLDEFNLRIKSYGEQD